MIQVKSKLIEFSNTLRFMDTFGSRVRQARLDAQLSQESLARQVGVSQGLIGQIESGKNQGTKHIAAIARVLNVSADWLENGRSTRERAARADSTPVGDASQHFADARPALTPAAQALVDAVVEADKMGLPSKSFEHLRETLTLFAELARLRGGTFGVEDPAH
ncbi:helix-turn-helix domain-containing protein [Burkholderia multivorans]|uniref:helix-turn-helix domain-containing protein n=2 Tax=Burkholderia multivorans TaxID=87883 RepID=UPI00201B047A|nr:helix-turn-helix transcriptional regulator [Burkholderia multivorans]MCL4655175.1 helix-turn-helix domain-containing protein [Burkholderia multivorans]